MTAHRPGQCFMLWNRAVDVFAPGTGTRRIQARLRQLSKERDDSLTRNDELASEIQFLRRQLHCLTGERNLLVAQDEWNVDIHESKFMSSHLLDSRNTESTMHLHVVN